MKDTELLNSAKSGPRRQGKKDLIKHLEGIKLARGQAIKAKCYECDGMGETGKCEIESCPFYHFSPYKQGIKQAGKGRQPVDSSFLPKCTISSGQSEKTKVLEAGLN